MNSIRLLNRRAAYFAIAVALAVTAVLPALVSAAQVTERSIALSNSSISATGVSYEVKFTAPSAATAMILDFCSDTPLLGQSCASPAGFSVGSVTTPTSGFTVTAKDANTTQLNGTINSGVNTVVINGVTNPSATGALYARITTYSGTNASTYVSATNPGTVLDDGGIAMSISNTIGVSGAVLESMTFCVSKVLITDNCVTTQAPVLQLGETVGSVVALDSGFVSSGSIHTQISTNAANGAIVSLKSNALDCGGLKRAGAPTACDIAPALLSDITAGQAKFGVKTATASTGVDRTGVLVPFTGSGYSSTAYALNYAAGNGTGVTSSFGDPFLQTSGAPANNQNMELTFGASVSNDTPAGLYSADISLIATGKF